MVAADGSLSTPGANFAVQGASVKVGESVVFPPLAQLRPSSRLTTTMTFALNTTSGQMSKLFQGSGLPKNVRTVQIEITYQIEVQQPRTIVVPAGSYSDTVGLVFYGSALRVVGQRVKAAWAREFNKAAPLFTNGAWWARGAGAVASGSLAGWTVDEHCG